MKPVALTDDLIRQALLSAKQTHRFELSDAVEPGLRLRAGPRGGVWSILWLSHGGGRQRTPLGKWPGVSIVQARAGARAVKGLAVAPPPSATAQFTIDEAITAYGLEQHGRLKRLDERLVALRKFLGDVLSQDLCKVRPGDILSAALSTGVVTPVQANRSLAYAKTFFTWALTNGHIAYNPASGIRKPTRELKRQRILSLDEFVEIWDAAEYRQYPFGHAIRLLLLTMARRSEIGGMRASELDLPDGCPTGTWTIAADRSRSRAMTPVPLSPIARMLVEASLDHRMFYDDLVFTTDGVNEISGWSNAKIALDRHIAIQHQGDGFLVWRLDDIRSSFAVIARTQLGLSRQVIDLCLGRGRTHRNPRAEDFAATRAAIEAWESLLAHRIRRKSSMNGGSIFPDA